MLTKVLAGESVDVNKMKLYLADMKKRCVKNPLLRPLWLLSYRNEAIEDTCTFGRNARNQAEEPHILLFIALSISSMGVGGGDVVSVDIYYVAFLQTHS